MRSLQHMFQLLLGLKSDPSTNTEQKFIRSHLNHFGYFKDASLKLEYDEFTARNRSAIFIALFDVFFTATFVNNLYTTLITNQDIPHYDVVIVLSHIQWIVSLLTCFLGYLFLVRDLSFLQTESRGLVKLLREHGHFIQHMLLITITSMYALRLIIRVAGGKCLSGKSTLETNMWACNPSADVHELPAETTVALLLTPVLYTSIMRETRFDYLLLSWAIVCCTMALCGWYMKGKNVITILLPYSILTLLIFCDGVKQNILCFLNNKHLKLTLEENEKMAASVRASEMRHLIANVAHDLKTVREIFKATELSLFSYLILLFTAIDIFHDCSRFYQSSDN